MVEYRATFRVVGQEVAVLEFTLAEELVRRHEFRAVFHLTQKHCPPFGKVLRVERKLDAGWQARRWLVPQEISPHFIKMGGPVAISDPLPTWPT